MLDREAIAGLIPHAGDMCLLDRVLGWDDCSIRCRSDSHRRSDHPLRRYGRLGAVHLVEYAAQATAIHHALLAPRPECARMPGYLAAVRHVRLEVNWLDEIAASLELCCRRLIDGGIYGFHACAGGQELASGRITVVSIESAVQDSEP